jgi:hypothetical protein
MTQKLNEPETAVERNTEIILDISSPAVIR